MISRNRFQFQGFGSQYIKKPEPNIDNSIFSQDRQEYLNTHKYHARTHSEQISCDCDVKALKTQGYISRFSIPYSEEDESYIDSVEKEARKIKQLKVQEYKKSTHDEKFSLTDFKNSSKRRLYDKDISTSSLIKTKRIKSSQENISIYDEDLMEVISLDTIKMVDGIPVETDFKFFNKNTGESESINLMNIARITAGPSGRIHKLIFLGIFYNSYSRAENIDKEHKINEKLIAEIKEIIKSNINENSLALCQGDKYAVVSITTDTDDNLSIHIAKIKSVLGVRLTIQHKEAMLRANAGQGTMCVRDIKRHLRSQMNHINYSNRNMMDRHNFQGDLYCKSSDTDVIYKDHIYTREDHAHQVRAQEYILLHNDTIED